MLRNTLIFSLIITTVLWGSSLLSINTVVAASSGDLVKKAGSPAVYYIGEDLKLHAFPSSEVFFSWYDNFDGVITISDSEFNNYEFGENVFVRPGAKLVQAVDGETPWNILNGKVYAVSGNGTLHHISSASIAAELFGPNWATMITPVPVSIFTQYTESSDINSSNDYKPLAQLNNSSNINAVKFPVMEIVTVPPHNFSIVLPEPWTDWDGESGSPHFYSSPSCLQFERLPDSCEALEVQSHEVDDNPLFSNGFEAAFKSLQDENLEPVSMPGLIPNIQVIRSYPYPGAQGWHYMYSILASDSNQGFTVFSNTKTLESKILPSFKVF